MRSWEVSGVDITSVSGMPLKRINTDPLSVLCHCYWITEKTDVMATVMCNIKLFIYSWIVTTVWSKCVQMFCFGNHQTLIVSAKINKAEGGI